METVICKEVIVSTLKTRGNGTPEFPIRIITEVYEKDGTLIAENDPHSEYDKSAILKDIGEKIMRHQREVIEASIRETVIDVDDIVKVFASHGIDLAKSPF